MVARYDHDDKDSANGVKIVVWPTSAPQMSTYILHIIQATYCYSELFTITAKINLPFQITVSNNSLQILFPTNNAK